MPATHQVLQSDLNDEMAEGNGSLDSGVATEVTTFEFIDLAAQLIQSDCAPIVLWGPTGTGKSQIVRQAVQKVSNGSRCWKPRSGVPTHGGLEVISDWGLIDLRVSLLEPTDLMGLPDLNGEVVRWAVPSELPAVGQEDRFPARGVLFLEELNHAQPAMQNACFSLILDRRCGPHRLLPGWRIVAACNSAQENANTFPMSAPLRNRFIHFHIRCSLDSFKRWALQHEIDPRIIAFLNWNPGELHKVSEHPEESFPSPRSWASASGLLKILGDGQVGSAIAACVGPGTASIFMAFLQLEASSDLAVDVAQVLRGKVKAPNLSTDKPDVAWAFTGRVTALIQQSPALLPVAIGFYCSAAWKEALEIGRTGLADLKYLVSQAEFNQALTPHLDACTKYYGELLV